MSQSLFPAAKKKVAASRFSVQGMEPMIALVYWVYWG